MAFPARKQWIWKCWQKQTMARSWSFRANQKLGATGLNSWKIIPRSVQSWRKLVERHGCCDTESVVDRFRLWWLGRIEHIGAFVSPGSLRFIVLSSARCIRAGPRVAAFAALCYTFMFGTLQVFKSCCQCTGWSNSESEVPILRSVTL